MKTKGKRQSKNIEQGKPVSPIRRRIVDEAFKSGKYKGFVPKEIVEGLESVVTGKSTLTPKSARTLYDKGEKNRKIRDRFTIARSKSKIPPADMAKTDKAMKKAAKADREALAKRGVPKNENKITRMLKTNRTKQ